MIIVYGKNSNDITILNKYEQLTKLGFMNVYIYTGGLFEWLLLHEIYGKDLFKITKYEIDILKYRPKSVLLHLMSQGKNYEEDMSGYLGNSGGIMDNARSFIENIKTNQYVPDIAINIPPPSQSRRSGKEDRTSIFWSNNGNNSDGDADADGSGSDNNSENETTDYENQQRKKSSSSIFSGLKWLFK
jgi:hypothetical protein